MSSLLAALKLPALDSRGETRRGDGRRRPQQ